MLGSILQHPQEVPDACLLHPPCFNCQCVCSTNDHLEVLVYVDPYLLVHVAGSSLHPKEKKKKNDLKKMTALALASKV